MSIGALVTLVAKPGAEDEMLTRLKDVAQDVRGEPGNLLTLLLADEARPGEVLMVEVYRDQAAIEAHKSAPHTREKGPEVHALLAEPMRVRWLEVIDAPEFE